MKTIFKTTENVSESKSIRTFSFKRRTWFLQLVICTILFLSTSSLWAQAPNWAWAKRAGGTGFENTSEVYVDISGNSYIVGDFGNAPFIFGNDTIIGKGGNDIFILKYNSNGNEVWARTIGGTKAEKGMGIHVDKLNNVYVTGDLGSDTLIFSEDTISSVSTTGSNIVVLKYDANGNELWAKSVRGNGYNYDHGLSVTTDPFGHAYIAGSFTSTLNFAGTQLVNNGNDDIIILKYDSDGNELWATSAGGSDHDKAYGIHSDTSGAVYVTGTFESAAVDFDGITLTNNNSGTRDLFVVKYDVNGNILWAKNVNGNDAETALSIDEDAFGNVYIAGYFHSSQFHFGGTTITNNGSVDMFVIKYDANGNELWGKGFGGTDNDYGQEISIGPSGGVYIAGFYTSPRLIFGGDTLNSDAGDGFVLKYDANGNEIWAKNISGPQGNVTSSLDTDTSDNIYVYGKFVGPSVSFGATTLVNIGGTDLFLAKLGSNTPDTIPGDTTIPIVCARDTSCTNELQNLSSSQSVEEVTLQISDGNSTTFSIDDADASDNNELQSLSLSGNNLLLTQSNSISLPADQVDDADADASNELQSLSLSNDTLSLSQGGFVKLPGTPTDNADADSTNELQQLSLNGNDLSISKGNTVTLAGGSEWTENGGMLSYTGGEVGIGTANPASRLHLGGDLLLDNCRYFTSTRSDDGFSHELFGMDNNNDMILNRSAIIHGKFSRTIVGFGQRSLDVRNQQNQTILRITANGKMGINQASPSYTLDVNGNGRINTQWIVSDARYKKNVTQVQGAVAQLSNLEGMSYRYRNEAFQDQQLPRGINYGFIAQDLEKALPDLVHTDEQGYHAVNYDGLIAFLTEAIKEQQEILDSRKEKLKEVTALEAELITLKALVAALCDDGCPSE